MKQIILSITTLAIALNLSAQKLGDLKPKGKKENTESSGGGTTSSINVSSGANQSDMIDMFLNGSGKVIFTECENTNTFTKPQTIDRNILIYNTEKNKDSKIKSFKTQIQSENSFKTMGSKNYPICLVG